MRTGSQSTILVVDDNLGARKSIEALLASERYNFLLADSGHAALDLLEHKTPDVILLDVMMPGMNGYTVCEKIRANPRISDIPVLMITALDDEESMIQGIESGADDFLPKPISKTELKARIRSILRLNRFRKIYDERKKFEIVVAQSQLGYLVLDSKTRIQFLNSAARKILCLEEGELNEPYFFDTAKHVYSVQPTDIEQSFLNPETNALPEPFLLVRSRTQDTPARWIRASFEELESQSNQLLLKLEDITERIISFQQKQTFSRMISHKMLTPLNAIKASYQMIKGIDEGSERLAQIVSIQEKGIERLEYDIQSILSFLAYEKQAAKPMSFWDTAALLQGLSDVSAFPFSVEGPSQNTEKLLNISSNAFEASIREIIENAVKFCEIGTPKINCQIDHDGETAEYIFSNNSKVLTEQELENAWKPYWQADRYSTGEIKGMGLGLSLIATNVWTAGGTCKIKNNSDHQGVTLTLTFPLLEKQS